MGQQYIRYGENDPRAKGRGVPPDVLARLQAGEKVPGWEVLYDKPTMTGGPDQGEIPNPTYQEGRILAIQRRDPTREWYSTYSPDGALMNEGDGKNGMTAKDLITYAAVVASMGGASSLVSGLSSGGTTGAGSLGQWAAEDAMSNVATSGLTDAATTTATSTAATAGDSLAGMAGQRVAVDGAIDALGSEVAAEGLATGAAGAVTPGTAAELSQVYNAGATTAATGSTLTSAGTAIKDGFDTLNKVAGTPVGKLVTAGIGTALAAGVADAATPDPDTSRTDRLIDEMITDAGIARGRSQNLWDDYIATWRPIEHEYADRALNYDTPERRNAAAAQANDQVTSQYDVARSSAERDAMAAGVDPSTIATMGLNTRVVQAKDTAQAENTARTGVESRGMEYLSNAAHFGRGLSSDSRAESGVANADSNLAINGERTVNDANNNATQNRNAIFGDILGAGANLLGRNSSGNGKGNWWENSLWDNGTAGKP